MTVVLFPKATSSRTDYLAECLIQCLPANSCEEIRAKIKTQFDETISLGRVWALNTRIRKNPQRYNFTINQTNRGLKQGVMEGYRFNAIPVDRTQPFTLDEATIQHIVAGLVATIKTAKSLDQNEAMVLLLGSNFASRPNVMRAWRAYAKQLRRAAEDAEELLEAIG